MYRVVESLYHTPEANIILNVSYTSIKKKSKSDLILKYINK